MNSWIEFGYLGLFASAFLAATLLPVSSEVVLTALLLQELSPFVLVVIATFGNVLGSLTNYALGFWLGKPTIQRITKTSEQQFESATTRFNRYGVFALCFAWVPIIGDPLTVVAGVMRIRLLWFLCLVTLGKLARYIVLAVIVLGVS